MFNWLKQKFKETRNFLFSRYELSFKQETLFKVEIKTDRDGFVKTTYMVGQRRPGTFSWDLEKIEYDMTTLVEYIKVHHMSRPPKTIYGPILMLSGDTLQVSYSVMVD